MGGHTVAHNSPAIARALGIAAVYQQPSLFPDLTVAENIALSLESGGIWRKVDWKAPRRARPRTSGARGQRYPTRPAGRDAQHARAADRGNRQGDRRASEEC